MDENQPNTDPEKRKGRKKRKNFLSNAKKYAKKGQMGRGTQMPEELYQYFVGILEAMKKGIEDEDERQALVTNVLDRTKGEELNVIGNQLGCRVIELLLPYSSAEDLERFMEIVSPELRKLCSDNFTSHVVETVLSVSCQRATELLQVTEEAEEDVPKKKQKKEKKEQKYTDEHINTCNEFTLKICKYALNNLEDFVWDQYANHILRSAMKCLSGITLLPGEKPKVNMFIIKKPSGFIPPQEKTITYKNVPQDYKDLVVEFANRLSAWPQFKDLPYQNITSGLLQVLLYALKNVDKSLLKMLITKLLNESFAPDGWVPSIGPDNEKKDDKIDVDDKEFDGMLQETPLPPVFESEPAVRLLEAALFVAKKKTYTQLYARCFINRLAQLAARPALNYPVQRLIDNCQIKEEFEPMFDELSGGGALAAALAGGSSGVLVALAKACLRTRARQAQFLASLEAALKTNQPEFESQFPHACLRLLPADRLQTLDQQTSADADEKGYFINVHGSVILQTILHFQRPARAAGALVSLPAARLARVLCDPKGSHVADALCAAPAVGAKTRDKLCWKLRGYYQKLALSQHGSRAFEAIFSAATPEQKLKIMSEISEKASLLNSTPTGRLIATKFNLELFKRSQDSWVKSVGEKKVVEEK